MILSKKEHMFSDFRKTQSITEYAVLITLAISAMLAVQVYTKRGLEARLRTAVDAYTDQGANFTSRSISTSFNILDQYEPYSQEEAGETYQEEVRQQFIGNSHVNEEIVSAVGISAAGGYNAQVGSKEVIDERDKHWISYKPKQ